MKYAYLFWKLFGLSVLDWDDPRFLYSDFDWMRSTADAYEKQLKEASKPSPTR